MSSPATILPFILLLLFIAVGETTTVYEVLEEYNFPVGLLPTGVTSYTLDEDTGEFVVNLDDTCEFSVQGYDLKYESTITGVISEDKLTDLDGVSVYILLFWIDIVEVTRDDDQLEFSVGIATASFDVDNFGESPECGCGFDCNGLEGKKCGRKSMKLPKLLDWLR